MELKGLFDVFAAILIAGQWVFYLATDQVPEIRYERAKTIVHLIAELLVGVALFLAAWGLFTQQPWGQQIHLVSIGMLLYTSLNSSGHFFQIREWSMVGVFLVLFASGLLILRLDV